MPKPNIKTKFGSGSSCLGIYRVARLQMKAKLFCNTSRLASVCPWKRCSSAHVSVFGSAGQLAEVVRFSWPNIPCETFFARSLRVSVAVRWG